MDTSKLNSLAESGWALLLSLAIKVLEALALWIVGRWLIGLAVRIITRTMTRQKIDPTLIRYVSNAVSAILNIVLVIAILGFFGVQTTSLAALIAAAGVAIGWHGADCFPISQPESSWSFCSRSRWVISWLLAASWGPWRKLACS